MKLNHIEHVIPRIQFSIQAAKLQSKAVMQIETKKLFCKDAVDITHDYH